MVRVLIEGRIKPELLQVLMSVILILTSLIGPDMAISAEFHLYPPSTGVNCEYPDHLYPDWWGQPPETWNKSTCPDPGSCVKCHPNNAEMDQLHALPCSTCHKGNAQETSKDLAHEGLIPDPGDLDLVDQTCGRCHPEHARNVKISRMALAPNLINHTRYAFGAQDTASPAFGVRELSGLKEIPVPKLENLSPGNQVKTPTQDINPAMDMKSVLADLGDDLLRRSCLRCHLYTKGSARAGEQRGKGCSACHTPYSNSDSKKPYAHVISKSLGVTPCLKCHNSNHVGCDYVGLFEKDFNRGFRSPIVNGAQAPTIYGSEQHRLMPDTHYTAGMICSDCHTSAQIHGTGSKITQDNNKFDVACESCHVVFSNPRISRTDKGEFSLKRRPDIKVPVLRRDILPHNVDKHRRLLTCVACHAAWSFQDYGFHLMLDERAEYWMWSINAAQNDPQIQDLLRKFVGDYAELVPPRGKIKLPMLEKNWTHPKTRDWLNGKSRSGAWFRGFTIRRWANPPLGLNAVGKVTIMRPMRQYVVSWVKPDGTVALDSVIPTTGSGRPALVMDPYSPHTIQKKGRQCHDCHGSPKAIGLGDSLIGNQKFSVQPILRPEKGVPGVIFRWDALLDENGNALQFSSYPGAGPLGPEIFRKLLFPGSHFRSVWSKYLSGSR